MSPELLKVQVRDLYFAYRTRDGRRLPVLAGVTFSVPATTLVAVLGPSGCGKSTLLRLIAGLDKEETGCLTVDGEPVAGPSRDRTLVPQDGVLMPWLTAVHNVALGLKAMGVGRRERLATASRYLAILGISDFANEYPTQLSGGMRQRVALARALAIDPEVVLMDEPFAALDWQARRQLHFDLLELRRSHAKASILVTHDVDEALQLADAIVVLSERPARTREVISVHVPHPRSDPRHGSDIWALRERLMTALGLNERRSNGVREPIVTPGERRWEADGVC